MLKKLVRILEIHIIVHLKLTNMQNKKFYLLTFFLVLFLYSCSDNEMSPQIQLEQRNILSIDDLPGLGQRISEGLGIRNGSGFSMYDPNSASTGEFDINWEQVYQLIDSAGSETYTFRITDNDYDRFTFYNLVAKRDANGNFSTPYIIQYTMADSFIPIYLETGSLRNFEGKIRKMTFSLDANTGNNLANLDGQRSVLPNPDCPNDDGVDMSSSNGTNSGGTSNSGSDSNSSGIVITSYMVCEYFLVTDVYSHTFDGTYTYTDEVVSLETSCWEQIDISYAEANDDDTGCDPLDDDVPILDEDFEDSIDDSKLKDCFKNILSEVKKLEKGMSWIVQEFDNAVPGNNGVTLFNWTLQDGTTQNSYNAETESRYDWRNNRVITTVDNNKFSDATDLSIVRTLLHEAVHAYLVTWTHGSAGNIPLQDKTYPELFSLMNSAVDANTAQHGEIVKTFLKPIAEALQEYGDKQGYSLDAQFYSDFAWGGLTSDPKNNNEDYDWFKQAVPKLSDRKKIKSLISIEQNGRNIYGDTQVQKGKKAGC